MDIIISSKFQWGKLFNNKIDFPMDCKLYIKNKQALIYVNLISDKDTPLDLLELLNNSFGTTLPKKFLQVNKAGFFSYINDTGKIIDDNELKKIFSIGNIPANIAMEVKNIHKPTCLWCCISMKSLSFFNQLIEIGMDKMDNEWEMLTILYKEDIVKSSSINEVLNECFLFVRIPNIKLLGLFIFKDLSLYIKLSQKNEYFFKGSIFLKVFEYELICKGEIKVKEENLYGEIKVSISNGKDIMPIDNMQGILFGEMIFCIDHKFSEDKKPVHTSCQIKGIVEYSDYKLEGYIFFNNDKVIMVKVVLQGNIAISTIFKNSIPKIKYPDNLFDFAIEKDSELYYCIEDEFENDKTTITYQKGFNIFAKLTLKLRSKIYNIQGHLNINNKGISGEILLNEGTKIDLYLIQFKAIDNDKDSLPKIIFFNKEKISINLSSGLYFLGEACGKIKIGCYKDNKNNLSLEGSFTAPQAFNKFLGISSDKNISLNFTYSKASGFKCSDWPKFDFVDEQINFIKEFKKYLNSSKFSCEKIGDFLFEKYFKISFKFTPKIQHDNENDEVYLTLNGKCILKMNEDEITDIEIKDLIKITIPEDLTIKKLPDIVVKGINSALGSIIETLVNDEEKLMKVLAIIGGKEIVKEISKLICRKMIPKGKGHILKTAGEAVSGASAGATAGTGYGIGECFGGCFAIGAGILAINTLFFGKETTTRRKPDKVQNLQAEYDECKICINWSKVELATDYLIVILNEKNDDKLYEQKIESKHNITVELELTNVDDLIVNVLAINKYVYSEKSSCKIREKVDAPQNVRVDIIQNNMMQLAISWGQVKDILNYIISIKNDSGQEIYIQKIEGLNTLIDIPIAWSWGNFVVNIATVDKAIGEWSDDVKFALDLNNLALRAKYHGLTAKECGLLLYEANSNIDCKQLIMMLKDVEYDNVEIALVVKVIWAKLTDMEIVKMMIDVYGEPLMIKEIIAKAYKNNKNGRECAETILKDYANVSSKEIGILMKKEGYDKTEITNAIKFIRPLIERNELENLLREIYK